MRNAFVYILECADGSYYVGSHRGDDVDHRVQEHQSGKYPGAYTFARRPVKLAWCEWFSRFDEAVQFERRLKGWSRAKKQALIRGDVEALTMLSRRSGVQRRLRGEP